MAGRPTLPAVPILPRSTVSVPVPAAPVTTAQVTPTPVPTPVNKTVKEQLMETTLSDLKEMCRMEHVKGFSNKPKAQVIDLLLAHRSGTAVAQESPKKDGLTVPQLRAAIKNLGGKNYSQKKKADLEAQLAELIAKPAVVPTVPAAPIVPQA